MAKRILSALAVSATIATGAFAEDGTPPPAMMAEAAMSEQLIAMGVARNDPLLILAALRMRGSLGENSGTVTGTFTSNEDALAAARDAAAGDPAMTGLIEDVAAEGSRRMTICSSYRMCF